MEYTPLAEVVSRLEEIRMIVRSGGKYQGDVCDQCDKIEALLPLVRAAALQEALDRAMLDSERVERARLFCRRAATPPDTATMASFALNEIRDLLAQP